VSFARPLGEAAHPVPLGEREEPSDELFTSSSRFWARFFANRAAVVGLVFVAIVALVAIFASTLAPFSPDANFRRLNSGPTGSHWLGTDDIGRDILSRIMYGARVSMEAAVLIVGLAMVAALPIGLIAGYFGGRVDSIIMRVVDAFFAFPPLVLALTVDSLLGPTLLNESISLAIVFSPGFIRLIRGQVLGVREETFIEASRSLGAGHRRMITRHIFPNVASPMIVQVALALGFAVLAEAGLSFLGLGVQPPAASWGGMLTEAYQFIFTNSWGLIVPGAAIALTVLAFNLVADGMRDALGRERFKADA
jgi:ABC-type dipeptide/oligopeptide/nickel transport system permease subunit